jgi:hypothetical protein
MTLTEVVFWTKRFGLIGLGFFIILFASLIYITMKHREEPVISHYLEPNFACTQGREDFIKHKLEIPSLQLAEGTEMIFDIRTDTGKVGSLPNIINVYKTYNPRQSIRSQADATTIANNMGFDNVNIERVGTEVYRWVDERNGRTLEILARNLNNISLRTDLSVMKKNAEGRNLPSEEEARSIAVNALSSIGILPPDYSGGNHKTTLLNINPDGTFSKERFVAEADLIKVDFFRTKSMITIPSYIEDSQKMVQEFSRRTLIQPRKETIIINNVRQDVYNFNTLVSFSETQRSNIVVYVGPSIPGIRGRMQHIYRIDYTYWPIPSEPCGTYKLIDPELAIDKVQQGEGSLVYLFNTGGDDVVDYMPRVVKKFVVLDIFLVYYEDREISQFIQPVYLVSGEAIFDDNTKGTFDFFYPAINYDIIP